MSTLRKCVDSEDDDDFYVAPYIEEPFDPNKKPMYSKHLVYYPGEEFSLEEIRARQYMRTSDSSLSSVGDMKLKEINGEKLSSVKNLKPANDEIAFEARKKFPVPLDALTDKENYPNRMKQANVDLKEVAALRLQVHGDLPRSGAPLKGSKKFESQSIEKSTDSQIGGKIKQQIAPNSSALLDKENNPRVLKEGIAVGEDISVSRVPKHSVVASNDQRQYAPIIDVSINKENIPKYVKKSDAPILDAVETSLPKHSSALVSDKQQHAPCNKENDQGHVKNISSLLKGALPASGISKHSDIPPLPGKQHLPMEDSLLGKENNLNCVKNSVALQEDSFPAANIPKPSIEDKTYVKEDMYGVNGSHLEDDVFTQPWSHVELDVTSYTKAFSMPDAISTPGFGGGKSRIPKGPVSDTKTIRKCIAEKVENVGEPGVVELSVIEETSRELMSGSSGANSVATLPTPATDRQNPGGNSSRVPAIVGGGMAESSRPQLSRIPCSVSRAKQRSGGGDLSFKDSNSGVNSTTQNETLGINSSAVNSNKRPRCGTMDDICRQMEEMIIAVDPFEQSQIDHLLNQLTIPVSSRIGYYSVPQKIPMLKANSDFHLRKEARDGGHLLKSLKAIGQGSYAKVYKAYSMKWKKMVALKVQKPACPWEFYISHEIHCRVTDHLMKNSFMNVKEASVFNDGSILISDFMEHGTLLDIINLFKIRRIRFPESFAVYFTIEVLKIINLLHSCKIIHADIKPDNFLLRRLPQVNEDFSSFGQTVLQLIDLGRCIDMTLYPENACFNAVFQKTFFQCIEMRLKKEWSYQVDMFHIASLVHVMIFGDFMDVVCKEGVWNVTKKVPRNLNQDLWNWFFNVMLNIESCAKLPNLTEIINKFEKVFLDSMVQDMATSVSSLRKFFNEDKAKVKLVGTPSYLPATECSNQASSSVIMPA